MIGTIGIASGAMAAADRIEPKWLWGVIAATSTSFVTFLGPMQKARQYHRAFHLTDQACLDFEISKIDADALSSVLDRARAISMGEGKVDV